MMIAMLLAATTAAQGLGAIGRQDLPARGCAAFLWDRAAGRLVAMAGTDPAHLKLVLDGVALDLPLAAQTGDAAAPGQPSLGFPARGDYAVTGVGVALELTLTQRPGLVDGAQVPAAALTITRPGKDLLVVPVVGMIGCARS